MTNNTNQKPMQPSHLLISILQYCTLDIMGPQKMEDNKCYQFNIGLAGAGEIGARWSGDCPV
jgi:hypothetical protein